MLDRLFENPAEKLQKILKFVFAGMSIAEIILIIVYHIAQISVAARVHNWGSLILSLVLMLIEPLISIILNYIACLFSYMIISFFEDVHEIRMKQ